MRSWIFVSSRSFVPRKMEIISVDRNKFLVGVGQKLVAGKFSLVIFFLGDRLLLIPRFM